MQSCLELLCLLAVLVVVLRLSEHAPPHLHVSTLASARSISIDIDWITVCAGQNRRKIAATRETARRLMNSRAAAEGYPPAVRMRAADAQRHRDWRHGVVAVTGAEATAMGMGYAQGGTAVGKSRTQATRWWNIGAQKGDAASKCNLASSYLCGRGVEKDVNKSWDLYQQVVEESTGSGQAWSVATEAINKMLSDGSMMLLDRDSNSDSD